MPSDPSDPRPPGARPEPPVTDEVPFPPRRVPPRPLNPTRSLDAPETISQVPRVPRPQPVFRIGHEAPAEERAPSGYPYPRESTDELPNPRPPEPPRAWPDPRTVETRPPEPKPPEARAEPKPAPPVERPRPAAVETRGMAEIDTIRPSAAPAVELSDVARWQPREPRTWEEAGLDPVLGEQLVLRYLAGAHTAAARQVSDHLALALPLTKDLLEQLKQGKLLQHRGATGLGDFIYELTDAGRNKAIEYKRMCAYVGPAPVPFPQYLAAVQEQALRSRAPSPADLDRAFADLVVPSSLLSRLGPAITSGRALFLHGDAGNGKTSIAERVTRCFGDQIWIPHTLLIDGHVVKLYDPATHEAVDPAFRPLTPTERLDRRWIKIRRPTVIAGGELTLEMLEIQINPDTNICEAPLQLKANNGTLVIDDFGRQRIEPQLLLNRWIFPLERRIDFLRLPDGRKIPSPFDPLLIFSTNLEPRDLVDEAFLRRIPYKVQVSDPTEREFIFLFEQLARGLEVAIAPGALEHLVEVHYRAAGRKLRFCHPRDLLLQVVNQCAFERRSRTASVADLDRAVESYFGVL